jgi:C1A family cysteine protease
VQIRDLGGALPPTADISNYAMPVGNQGTYGSCQSYAAGYSTMGWWLNRADRSGNPLAPMFIFTQLMARQGQACGPDSRAYVEDALDLMKSPGIDTLAQYPSTTCVTPTQLQMQQAQDHRISGYQVIDLTGGAQSAIMNALANGGTPVILSISVYNEFANASASNYLVGPPAPESTFIFGHAVTALKYDQNGVWIQNQWGTGWGYEGWAELSWAFVNGVDIRRRSGLVSDAVVVTGLAAPSNVPPSTDPSCPGPGDYCGGDGMSGDQDTLYHCAAAGQPPASSTRCMSGCQLQPSGTKDNCL